jgi:predicted nucleic-acid-binding Zn-ribbon protein
MADESRPPVTCPVCGNESLYETTTVAGRGQAPDLLPGLHGFFSSARLHVVACSECGAVQFFADEKARAKLPGNKKWKRL